jgi:ubiquitin carboxyl-terminal hydrolase 10
MLSGRSDDKANKSKILQVLIFCTPFYNFLDQVRQRTVHSMKSDTPLVDAMIMFMREFKVLASADSADVLRALLTTQALEQYGDPVTPQYVYDAIAKLERFNSMRVRLVVYHELRIRG